MPVHPNTVRVRQSGSMIWNPPTSAPATRPPPPPRPPCSKTRTHTRAPRTHTPAICADKHIVRAHINILARPAAPPPHPHTHTHRVAQRNENMFFRSTPDGSRNMRPRCTRTQRNTPGFVFNPVNLLAPVFPPFQSRVCLREYLVYIPGQYIKATSTRIHGNREIWGTGNRIQHTVCECTNRYTSVCAPVYSCRWNLKAPPFGRECVCVCVYIAARPFDRRSGVRCTYCSCTYLHTNPRARIKDVHHVYDIRIHAHKQHTYTQPDTNTRAPYTKLTGSHTSTNTHTRSRNARACEYVQKCLSRRQAQKSSPKMCAHMRMDISVCTRDPLSLHS